MSAGGAVPAELEPRVCPVGSILSRPDCLLGIIRLASFSLIGTSHVDRPLRNRFCFEDERSRATQSSISPRRTEGQRFQRPSADPGQGTAHERATAPGAHGAGRPGSPTGHGAWGGGPCFCCTAGTAQLTQLASNARCTLTSDCSIEADQARWRDRRPPKRTPPE